MAWCWCILLLASHRKRSDSVGDGDWDGGYDGGDGVISLNMQRYKLISTTNFIVQVDEENTVSLKELHRKSNPKILSKNCDLFL